MRVTHSTVNPFPDDPTFPGTKPSNWNADHVISDATTADVGPSGDRQYVTAAQLVVVSNTSGINTGDETITTIGSLIGSSTSKETLVASDSFAIRDGIIGSLKQVSYANLLTNLDGRYLQSISGIDHGVLSGLTDDDHTIYAKLTGRAGGTTLIGGTGVTDILKLQGTSGNGTLTSPAVQCLVGNDGATVAWTALNNGNVGFGTTSPESPLDVRGGVEFNRTGNATVGDFSVSGTSAPNIYFGRLSPTLGDSTYFHFRNRVNRDIFSINLAGGGTIQTKFETGGAGVFDIARDTTSLFRVNESTGNVGIGTTNPTAALQLKAGSDVANGAPFKLTSGALTTGANISAGAFEHLGDGLYFTLSTTVARKGFIFDDGTALTSGTIPVATTDGRLTNLTAQAHEANAKIDYAAGELDTEAEIISAINATNTTINSVLTKLENLKLFATA